MTRLLFVCLAVFVLFVPAFAFGQSYAAPGAAARGAPAAGPQPAAQQPTGPTAQVKSPYPVRPAAGQQSGVPQGPGAVPVPGPAGPAVPPAQPVQPDWAAKMTPQEQHWVDDVLKFWESRSEKTTLFECKFQRWDY